MWCSFAGLSSSHQRLLVRISGSQNDRFAAARGRSLRKSLGDGGWLVFSQRRGATETGWQRAGGIRTLCDLRGSVRINCRQERGSPWLGGCPRLAPTAQDDVVLLCGLIILPSASITRISGSQNDPFAAARCRKLRTSLGDGGWLIFSQRRGATETGWQRAGGIGTLCDLRGSVRINCRQERGSPWLGGCPRLRAYGSGRCGAPLRAYHPPISVY